MLPTAVPRLSTSCAVPPNMNKLAVVGQTPFGGPGADPQQTPTPLEGQAKPGPLQVYETDRPFFGSTPVGGLDIMTSKQFHHTIIIIIIIIISLSSSMPTVIIIIFDLGVTKMVSPQQHWPPSGFVSNPRMTQGQFKTRNCTKAGETTNSSIRICGCHVSIISLLVHMTWASLGSPV